MSDAADIGNDIDEFEELLRIRTRESHPGADPDAMSLVFLLSRLAGQVLGDLDTRVHRPRGFRWPGFRIMLAVMVCGPLEPRQIATVAGVTRASVSAVLNTLERDGLVDRRRDSADGRIVTIVLTEHGRTVLLETIPDQHSVEQEWGSALSSDERSTLIGLMRKMLAQAADGRQRSSEAG